MEDMPPDRVAELRLVIPDWYKKGLMISPPHPTQSVYTVETAPRRTRVQDKTWDGGQPGPGPHHPGPLEPAPLTVCPLGPYDLEGTISITNPFSTPPNAVYGCQFSGNLTRAENYPPNYCDYSTATLNIIPFGEVLSFEAYAYVVGYEAAGTAKGLWSLSIDIAWALIDGIHEDHAPYTAYAGVAYISPSGAYPDLINSRTYGEEYATISGVSLTG